jgi:translation initiation factor IF-2
VTAPKVRVHEISKELGVSNAEMIDVLAKDFGVKVKSHSSTVEQDVADKLRARFKGGNVVAVADKTDVKPDEPKSNVVIKPQSSQSQLSQQPQQALKSQNLPKSLAEVANTGAEKPALGAGPPQQGVVRPQQGQSPQAPHQQQSAQQQGQPPRGPQQGQPSRPGQPSQYPQQPQQNRPAYGQQSYNQPGQPPRGPQQPQPPRPGQFSQPQGGYQNRPAGQGPPQGMGPRPSQPGQQPYGQRSGQPGSRPSSPGGRPPSRGSGRPSGKSHTARQEKQAQASRARREEEVAAVQTQPKIVRIDEAIVVRDLATKLGLRETEIIKHLFMKGMMVTVNQTLDVDFAKTVAKEFEFEVEEVAQVKHEGEYSHLDTEGTKKLDATQFKNLTGRPPVVSIMGHVDHGKTTLLDAIRETRHKIVDTEAGGITQSIGAYTVQKDDSRIVFLDTPGHEAFTAMRMRGAQATDIAILVVAADDGVMPQTIEAINHAKVAKIPIIVAVNKIDKADADPDHVLVQLADHGLSAEKWGGDTLAVEVSALQKLGLDDLLDSILLVSELLELKADATVPGQGVIIEAQLDKRMGPVATALVQNGMLKVGDNVLIGSVGGRVRALIDDHGQRILQAGPATPVEILGLDGVPNAGDAFRVIHNDKIFKQELSSEKQRHRDERIGVTRAVAAGFSGRTEADETKESQFNLLVKADTQGSLEAVVEVLQRMTSDEIKINILHSATGDISEADVMLASTANALIIGFNTKADTNAQRLAEAGDVAIKRYDVIYHITEDIEKWVLGQLAPETEEVHAGTAEIRQIFKVGKTSVIAGCMVTSGKLIRNAKAVVLRGGKEIFSGQLGNLKRFKDDVKEVASGYECGISFDRFHDLQEGDTVEVYTIKALERTSL